MQGNKALVALVAFLGIMILIAFAALMFGFVHKAGRSDSPPDAASVPPSGKGRPAPDFGNVDIDLPAGASVTDFKLDGDRLVLRAEFKTPSGVQTKFFIVETNTGRTLGTVTMGTAN